jgi:hypothetical protein
MSNPRVEEMIDAALFRKGGNSESLIIPLHLAQMRLFANRQGIELYPSQDTPDQGRSKFIKKVWKENKLDLHLDRMIDLLCGKGSLLMYLRPTTTGYKIQYYWGHEDPSRSQFRDYYDADGNLVEVIIIYSYRAQSTPQLPGNLRWIKIRITLDKIYQSETEVRPTFDQDDSNLGVVNIYENSLEFMPCIVVKNSMTDDGVAAPSDFAFLASQIESHDEIAASIGDNMRFFGNPMLVSTRSQKEVLEAAGMTGTSTMAHSSIGGVWRPSISSQSNYIGYGSMPSTRIDDPRTRPGGGMKIRKVIGGVEPDERFGFIHPDPISPDHARYEALYRESIRTALGGVDENGISSGATAFELKSLYGRAAATAKKKAEALYTYGLCELFSMAIFAEENIYKRSLFNLMLSDQETFAKTAEEFNIIDWKNINADFLKALFDQELLPTNLPGLYPFGDRSVRWRWRGPVFEDSPRDILEKSIVGRNLREEGVKTSEILKIIYPDKTDDEINQLVDGGYPYRYLSNIAGTAGQLLGLWRELLSLPDPQDPQFPLGYRMDLSGMVGQSLEVVFKEMNLGYEAQPSLSVPISMSEIEAQLEMQERARQRAAQENELIQQENNGQLPNSSTPGSSSSGPGSTGNTPGSVPEPTYSNYPGVSPELLADYLALFPPIDSIDVRTGGNPNVPSPAVPDGYAPATNYTSYVPGATSSGSERSRPNPGNRPGTPGQQPLAADERMAGQQAGNPSINAGIRPTTAAHAYPPEYTAAIPAPGATLSANLPGTSTSNLYGQSPVPGIPPSTSSNTRRPELFPTFKRWFGIGRR